MNAQVQEALSRRYNCAGVIRLADGTYAFYEAGYRLVEAGVTAERLIELLNQYDYQRRFYQAQVEEYKERGGEIRQIGRQSDQDLMEDLGL